MLQQQRDCPAPSRFWKGLLAVWIGGGIGQSMAFLLARYLIGDFVSGLLRGKSRKWDMVSLQRHVPISVSTPIVFQPIGRSGQLCMVQ